jgi:integrase
LPDGKQRREFVGTSIEKARDADGKRRAQKRENRIFDMLPESKMTFDELAKWYLSLKSVKKLASYNRVGGSLANFNKVFGNRVVGTLKAVALENYQDDREAQGAAPATIDMEISIAKTMVNKGFDNDLIDGRTLKAFRRIKRKLKKGSNARERTLSTEEYLRLVEASQDHFEAILITAYNTGMRRGELLNLKWSDIDREKGFIRLSAEETKEGKPKSIPMNHFVREVLEGLPRHIHHDSVFTYKGEPIGHDFRRSLRTACRKAGISISSEDSSGFTFHDVRRTVKTNMLRAGIDKALRDTLLGHSLKGMDEYYLKPSEEDLREAMDRYTEWLETQITEAVEIVDQSVDQEVKKGQPR